MLNNKRMITIVSMTFLCVLSVLIDWIQWDIIAQITIKYNSLISGLFYYFMIGIRIVICVVLIVWNANFIKTNYKTNKIISFVPAVILIIVLLLQFVLPITDVYANWEYHFNYAKREHIVSMLNGDEEMELTQTNINTYTLPHDFRLTSHNSKVITEKNTDSLKVLFYIHKGMVKNTAIVYVSSTETVIDGDFGIEYDKVKLIEPHWYLVKY